MAISVTRKTSLVLGIMTIPVRIGGVEEKAPTANNFCDNDHAPEQVRMTLSCPTCGNSERSSFRLGVKVGGAVEFVEKGAKSDHSSAVLELKDGDEVFRGRQAKTLINGATYHVLPDSKSHPKADEYYVVLREFVREQSEAGNALVLRWGWSDKTSTWVLDMAQGELAIRQLLAPESVRTRDAVDLAPTEEMQAMVSMLTTLTKVTPFDADNYADQNAMARREAHNLAASLSVPAVAGGVDDLMARLKAAVAAEKKPARKRRAA